MKIAIIICAIYLGIILHANQGITEAKDYQKNSGLQWEWAISSLETFNFNPEDQVLDVGCGDGKITALIADRIPKGRVIGLDISKQMIDLASKEHQQSNLQFIEGDARAIPFKHEFDKIISIIALHWVLEQEQALQSMINSLKPGGQMLLVLPGKAANNVITLAQKVAASEKWAAYFPELKQERIYYTAEEYQALLEQLHVKILSLHSQEVITWYPNKEALIAFVKPLINFIDVIPVELRPLYIEEIVDQMIANDPPHADGSLAMRHNKIEVIAEIPRS